MKIIIIKNIKISFWSHFSLILENLKTNFLDINALFRKTRFWFWLKHQQNYSRSFRVLVDFSRNHFFICFWCCVAFQKFLEHRTLNSRLANIYQMLFLSPHATGIRSFDCKPSYFSQVWIIQFYSLIGW